MLMIIVNIFYLLFKKFFIPEMLTPGRAHLQKLLCLRFPKGEEKRYPACCLAEKKNVLRCSILSLKTVFSTSSFSRYLTLKERRLLVIEEMNSQLGV